MMEFRHFMTQAELEIIEWRSIGGIGMSQMLKETSEMTGIPEFVLKESGLYDASDDLFDKVEMNFCYKKVYFSVTKNGSLFLSESPIKGLDLTSDDGFGLLSYIVNRIDAFSEGRKRH